MRVDLGEMYFKKGVSSRVMNALLHQALMPRVQDAQK